MGAYSGYDISGAMKMATSKKLPGALIRTLYLAVILSAGLNGKEATATSLKPIEQAAFRLPWPRLPRSSWSPAPWPVCAAGRVRADLWDDELGAATAPGAETHFRIASNTKTMTSAVVMLMVQEGKLSPADSVSKYVSECPQRRQHHRRRTAENAERTLQLHQCARTRGESRS